MFNDNFIWTEFVGAGQRSTDIKFKEIEEKEWQYVVLVDSTSWGYPNLLAEKIEKEQNVSVKVQLRSQGGDHSSRLLGRLQTAES